MSKCVEKMKTWAWILVLFIGSWAILGTAQRMEPLLTLHGHAGSILSVAFSPDDKILASGSGDGTIKLWDTATGTLLYTLSGHFSGVNSVAFSSDGKLLASGSVDRTVKLWNVSKGELGCSFRDSDVVSQVTFSPDGGSLVSVAVGRITVRDVETGESMRTFDVPVSFVYGVAFGPEGTLFLTESGYEGTTRVWNMDDDLLVRSFACPTPYNINAIGFSSYGKLLAVLCPNDSRIRVWDTDTGEMVCDLAGAFTGTHCGVFSPDGKLLAAGKSDGINLWHVQTGSLECALAGYPGGFTVAFSNDGRFLASGDGGWGGSDDVWLWDVANLVNNAPEAAFTWAVFCSPGERVVVTPRVDDRISLDASKSADPDGEIVEYAWDWNDDGAFDETASEPVIGHRFQSAGEHAIILQVTDDRGATDETTKTITIAQPQPPEASFTISLSSPLVLEEVLFTDQSTDPDGGVVSWSWKFGDGTVTNEQHPIHFYRQSGCFEVTLTVTDDHDLRDTVSENLVVEHRDLIQAEFTFDVADESLHKIHLDASTSIDTMGTIVRYEWDWDGDGVYDTAVQVAEMTHRFDGEGPYHIILTIVDDQGNRASCTKEVSL